MRVVLQKAEMQVVSFAQISCAHVFAAVEAHRASTLSGSASRGDFSRIMQLEIVDSHAVYARERLRRT